MTTLTGPGGWIELSYGNGTQYHSHCEKSDRVARILFDCDPYAGKVTTLYNGMYALYGNIYGFYAMLIMSI